MTASDQVGYVECRLALAVFVSTGALCSALESGDELKSDQWSVSVLLTALHAVHSTTQRRRFSLQ